MSTVKKTLTIEQEEVFQGLTFIFRMSAAIGETPTGVDFSLKNQDSAPTAYVSGTAYPSGQVNVSISGSEIPNMAGVKEAIDRAKVLVDTPLSL